MRKTGNLFILAEMELRKERKPYTANDIIDKAIVIRKYLDEQEEAKEKTQFKKLRWSKICDLKTGKIRKAKIYDGRHF